MKTCILILLGITLLSSSVVAQDVERHVVGTVLLISESSITVETKAKVKTVVSALPQTRFLKAGSVRTIKDLKVGDHVLILAHKTAKGLQAQAVLIGGPKTKPDSHEK